ncbi:MAG TPA: hypothetical protein VI316_03145 [Candidatus Dormibacteraeota bacterium]
MTDPTVELLRRLDRTAPAPSRDGRPVYDAPWQARLVAMTATVVLANPALEERFAQRLVAGLPAGVAGDGDSERYYAAWLEAAEALVG